MDGEPAIALRIRGPSFSQLSALKCAPPLTESDIMDRFVGGEDVPHAQLQHVWQNTTQAHEHCCARQKAASTGSFSVTPHRPLVEVLRYRG